MQIKYIYFSGVRSKAIDVHSLCVKEEYIQSKGFMFLNCACNICWCEIILCNRLQSGHWFLLNAHKLLNVIWEFFLDFWMTWVRALYKRASNPMNSIPLDSKKSTLYCSKNDVGTFYSHSCHLVKFWSA